MIELYTAATPNGRKISIALEEMQLPYTVHALDFSKGEQKTPAFLAINPNGRIPAIVDRNANGFKVFESGAILIYLAEKTGRFLPTDVEGRSHVLQWLMFQMGGVGPMMGQANVFHHYFAEKIPSVIDRYTHETQRLLGVLDTRLSETEYLAGAYSIADMATYPWVAGAPRLGLGFEDLPHLSRWLEAVGGRDAVRRGMDVPQSLSDAERVRRAQDMLIK